MINQERFNVTDTGAIRKCEVCGEHKTAEKGAVGTRWSWGVSGYKKESVHLNCKEGK